MRDIEREPNQKNWFKECFKKNILKDGLWKKINLSCYFLSFLCHNVKRVSKTISLNIDLVILIWWLERKASIFCSSLFYDARLCLLGCKNLTIWLRFLFTFFHFDFVLFGIECSLASSPFSLSCLFSFHCSFETFWYAIPLNKCP